MCPEKIDRSCAVGKSTPQRSTSVSIRPNIGTIDGNQYNNNNNGNDNHNNHNHSV